MESIYVKDIAGSANLTFPQHIILLSIWVFFLKMTTVLIYYSDVDLSYQSFNRHKTELSVALNSPTPPSVLVHCKIKKEGVFLNAFALCFCLVRTYC